METPPPYAAPAPKKSRAGLIIGIIIGVLSLCCILPIGGIYFFGKGFFDKSIGMVSCGVALDEIRSATLSYAEAHNGTLPKAETWQDDIKPYLTKVIAQRKDDSNIMKLPGANGGACDATAKTGMSFNSDLSGKKLKDIEAKHEAILVFEVAKEGRNLHEKYVDRGTKDAPKFIGSTSRGWVLMPIEGDPVFRDDKGNEQPIRVRGIRTKTTKSTANDSATE